MRITLVAGFAAALCLALVSGPLVADDVVSGLQPGESPGPFDVRECSGPDAGQSLCLVCQNGPRPVAMVFAREISEPLADLLVQLDDAVETHRDARMGAFLVLLTDDGEAAEEQLTALAEEHGISENVPLAYFEGLGGPPGHNVNPETDVTVVLYTRRTVVRNFAFAPGGLNDEAVAEIISAIPEIL